MDFKNILYLNMTWADEPAHTLDSPQIRLKRAKQVLVSRYHVLASQD